jgi:serine/threonine protein phosphatase PrpC
VSEALTASLVLNVAELSGLGGRATNEDAHRHLLAGQLACFAVSDGVGGEEGGEIASRLIVDTVIERFKILPSIDGKALRNHVDAAAAEVARRQESDPALAKMSATVAVLCLDCSAGLTRWLHLGDTRIYQFREGQVFRMTKDHSAVQQLVDAGYCAPSQTRTHPLRSSLLGAVGLAGEATVEVTEGSSDMQVGDAFLICTDGFWEWINEAQMAAALAGTSTAQAWLDQMELLSAQNSASAPKPRDNYTAFAVRVGDQTHFGQSTP